MKHTFLFILMFCCYGMVATAQQTVSQKANFATTLKITFGKDPGCDAGKGVCELVADGVPVEKQIKADVWHDRSINKLKISFKLNDLRNSHPKQVPYFVNEQSGSIVPVPRFYLDETFIFDADIVNTLDLKFVQPGISINSKITPFYDNGIITLSFYYVEIL